ncbi:MAG: hypothetical protein Kow00106_19060 [Anaerolineae bacterium]
MTSDFNPDPEEARDTSWKVRVYLLGALIGLAVGLISAYFYARVSEENGFERPHRIPTMDALKLAVSLLSVIRQITDLGAKRSD